MTVGLNVKINEVKQKTILRIEGRLDAASAPILENKLTELISAGKTDLILDFAKVDYLSSAGMRLLLSTTKKLKGSGGKLHFCSISEEVMEIIKMAGFERILSIYPTEQEAINAF
ncbi:MAG: STAS domain-containing protein [Simkania sp.]|uniref:Anti-sigma factor antagonist n=1 Tax=Simkania negevensis (strain ATCC VR-1471 / DSM 27360 / Z) TaxID=331113 RepID=F8L5J4_SIMNZ|nr:STAS domain-containing protein [Simkania negevensis]MCB1066777.1 STAS domain-containing protein [Simkania sp.]MCP5490777.1 STAS domain-containing protein [Chlamydiales bacterium]MCB1073983.1 STAS domain-containing protein [Simkania sp.]MCB1083345.1 STAS domain-containing protein [Simkania sp.]CCB89592.1 putative sigma regulatory factor [Simkania negevensis Z]